MKKRFLFISASRFPEKRTFHGTGHEIFKGQIIFRLKESDFTEIVDNAPEIRLHQ